MNHPLVYGEALSDLMPGLIRFRKALHIGPDGRYRAAAELPAEEAAPLARALKRAEAEMLLEEADSWPDGGPEPTPSQRTADALLRLVTSLAPPASPPDS